MTRILAILLLTGCATTTTTVDRDQEGYEMPPIYTVTVAVVSPEAVRVVCMNPAALGCSYWTDSHTAFVWLSSAAYADHEFEHLVFGPGHY